MKRLFPAFLAACWLIPAASAQPPPSGEAAEAPLVAPSRLYYEPPSFLLLLLRGDVVDVRYTPGSLDRAANLQLRLELASEIFEKWRKPRPELSLYVLAREEWERARYPVRYGLPIRVGRNQVAAPALGDDGTVRLWGTLLNGVLPQVPGIPMMGTPQHAATLVLSDTLVQLQVSEILVDTVGLGSESLWLRGVMTHLVSLNLSQRIEPGRRDDLDVMYDILARAHAPRTWSARDFDLDLGLRDWLYFQAQFHRGASAILDKEGKDSVKRMIKLEKNGRLTEGELLRRYDDFASWYRETFNTVSTRTD